MRPGKISWKKVGIVVLCPVVIGLVFHSSSPSFSFLRGYEPVRMDDRVRAYKLLGDHVQLGARIDRELAERGFQRIAEKRWFGGMTTHYESKGEMMEAFVATRKDQTEALDFWLRTIPQPRSRMGQALLPVTRLVTLFLHGPCCHSATVNSCIANVKQIEGAAQNWAMENPRMTNQVPADSDLFGPQAYIRTKPVCFEGGEYTRGNVSELPHCSVPWHTLK